MNGNRGGVYWAFVALLVVLYFLLTMGIGLQRWVPDLLTVAVLLAARRLPGAGAAAFGMGAGLVRDAVAVDGFGAGAVVLALLAYLGARSRDLFEGDSLLFMAAYLFVGKWAHDLLFGLLSRQSGRGPLLEWSLMELPLEALYAAFCGMVALILYRMTTRAR